MIPKISVVIPVYNAAQYLEAALESIARQTFEDFEVITIDDGSTDESLTILKKWEAQDARFTVITRENRGIAETLNEGFALAKGKYIARMDADDVSFLDRFEHQYKHMESNPNCVAVGGYYIEYNEYGSIDSKVLTASVKQRKHWMNIFNHARNSSYGNITCFDNALPFIAHPSAFIRKAALAPFKREVYLSRFIPMEDLNLWGKLIYLGDINTVNRFVIKYRLCENSLSSCQPSNLKVLFSNLNVYEFARYKKMNFYSVDKVGATKFLKHYPWFSLARILFYPIVKYAEFDNKRLHNLKYLIYKILGKILFLSYNFTRLIINIIARKIKTLISL